MLIINPLYDWAFKYLLDDNGLARKFLSTILKMEVEHLETRNIELPQLKDGNPFISRFDFKAIVQTAGGDVREVLIEIQKYRNPDPVSRFRAYLGESYLRREAYRTPEGEARVEDLPIIAVYILGYAPPDFRTPYLIVRNKAYDGVDESELESPGGTAMLLTHPAYFLVADPPSGYRWRGSRQEALLRLFRQKAKGQDPNTTYELEALPEDDVARDMARHLHRGTLDEQIVKQLKAEEDYYKAFGQMEEDIGRLEAEKAEAVRAAELERQGKEEAQKEAQQERQQREEAQRLAERERLLRAEALLREAEAKHAAEKARAKALESAREFLALGVPAGKAALLTGLDPAEVQALLDQETGPP